MPGEILKLIENVDPEDIDALDEIDGLVCAFIYQVKPDFTCYNTSH